MKKNRCLNFLQLLKFIQNKLSKTELTLMQEHIIKCKNCTDELILIQNMYNDMINKNNKTLTSVQYNSEEHISNELKERFFSGNLSKNKFKMINGHLKKCRICQEEFNSINANAQIDITPEEQLIIQKIEAVNIKDRLSNHKEYFILPDEETTDSLINQLMIYLINILQPLTPISRLGIVMAFLLVLMVPLYYGYQYFNISNTMAQAERDFSDFLKEPKIGDGELRPTGGFLYALVGKVRDYTTKPTIDVSYQSIIKAHEYKPNDIKINHYLGTLYFFSGNIDNAEEYYLKTLELDENNAKIFNDLALIDVHRKDFQKALEHLQKAIYLDPLLHEAHYNLAAVYEIMGDKEKAISAWKKYIELDSDENSSWNKLARTHLMELQP